MRYYLQRLRDGSPFIIYRSSGVADGDSYISPNVPDWTPDADDSLLGMLVKGEYDLDGLDPKDVDATIDAIRARGEVTVTEELTSV